jgi:hypothetical protein
MTLDGMHELVRQFEQSQANVDRLSEAMSALMDELTRMTSAHEELYVSVHWRFCDHRLNYV